MPVFKPMDASKLAFVQGMIRDQQEVGQGDEILRDGAKADGPFTLYDGWAYSYRDLPEGKAGPQRQILEVFLPGDLLGLSSVLTGQNDHAVRALTPCRVCVHDPAIFGTLFTRQAGIARDLTGTLVSDADRISARLTVIGQGSSVQRLAHFILETWYRLAQRGLAPLEARNRVRIPFPLERRHLAAALGMSGNHVRRSLLELEAHGLVRVGAGVVSILDRAGLIACCDFRPPAKQAGWRLLL
jgi:CRP/FNR family transcriptional regulator, anaerobic regulatory protein